MSLKIITTELSYWKHRRSLILAQQKTIDQLQQTVAHLNQIIVMNRPNPFESFESISELNPEDFIPGDEIAFPLDEEE